LCAYCVGVHVLAHWPAPAVPVIVTLFPSS
jgi:hypothetical protein